MVCSQHQNDSGFSNATAVNQNKKAKKTKKVNHNNSSGSDGTEDSDFTVPSNNDVLESSDTNDSSAEEYTVPAKRRLKLKSIQKTKNKAITTSRSPKANKGLALKQSTDQATKSKVGYI